MSWNQSGGQGKDPWSGKNKNQSPPELDKILLSLAKKLNSFVSKKPDFSSGKGPSPSWEKSLFMLVGLALAILAIVWLLFEFYLVRPNEKAVLQRFGKYTCTKETGLYWMPLLIDSVRKVNTQEHFTFQNNADEKRELLTKDAHIIHVSLSMNYRIVDPKKYLFDSVNPIGILHESAEGALRDSISDKTVDDLLVKHRVISRSKILKLLQHKLNVCHTGLEVVNVELSFVTPPKVLKDVFEQVSEAKEEERLIVDRANIDADNAIALAKTRKKNYLEEAKAYKEAVILNSEAHVEAFLAKLSAYKQSPQPTRDRLYLSTLEEVLKGKKKVLLATKENQNTIYLPLNKWFSEEGSTAKDSLIRSDEEVGEGPKEAEEKEIQKEKKGWRALRFRKSDPDNQDPRFFVNRSDYKGRRNYEDND